jgi:putative component of membrane protein insertase Oxa1/YidC/SpoIIIJ protein YidD
MQQMPTEWEQDVAEIYVNEHRLVRPDTNIKTALISVAIFVFATGMLVWLVHYVLISAGIVADLPSGVQDFYSAHRFLSMVIVCALVIVIEAFFCLKYAVIGTIKLYQHYAPEEIRRRCLFMPTCSECAILAVRKYGSIIGLCKSFYRLVYLCSGNIYKIHYPWDKKLKED